ncbi:UNVERIFIED_CONTAM: Ubiquitin carboxyl-terminal hydrolase 13 [Sesamum radiatum]|uniref:Ubiquitin carboxyl-terminal hydrolase 13 n=1 Tax=Sesamum radiatum TaxID=300843 RepID=A0AAW2UAD7_SESRA
MERREAHPSHFLLKIESVSLLLDGTDEKYESMEFQAGDHKWRIDLYPKGNGEGKGNSVSVYLNSVDAKSSAHNKKVKANFSLCIKNQVNDKHKEHHASDHWFSSSTFDWGWPRFIPLDDLNDPIKGFLVKDLCTIEVEILVKAVSCVPK